MLNKNTTIVKTKIEHKFLITSTNLIFKTIINNMLKIVAPISTHRFEIKNNATEYIIKNSITKKLIIGTSH